ncbi:MAG: hypothetical protein HUK16_02575 [Bacteroidales bacterium]|nr:hypothetical protein [Bacteroidales bacterium]
MKKKVLFFMALAMVGAFAFSCKKDNTNTDPAKATSAIDNRVPMTPGVAEFAVEVTRVCDTCPYNHECDSCPHFNGGHHGNGHGNGTGGGHHGQGNCNHECDSCQWNGGCGGNCGGGNGNGNGGGGNGGCGGGN